MLGHFPKGDADKVILAALQDRDAQIRQVAPGDGNSPGPVASPVKWAELLCRVWGLDALDCPRCHGRMAPIAVVENPEEAARYLAHTAQLTVHSRARAPPLVDAA